MRSHSFETVGGAGDVIRCATREIALLRFPPRGFRVDGVSSNCEDAQRFFPAKDMEANQRGVKCSLARFGVFSLLTYCAAPYTVMTTDKAESPLSYADVAE